MQKILLSLTGLFLIINFSNCSHKLNPEGSWQKSAIVADANLNEWSLPLRFGNKSGTIQYSITNDKENIYIALLSRDEATEEKILRMGMTVYFDPAGGDSKNISINYPEKNLGGPKNEDLKERDPASPNSNQKSRKQEMMLQSTSFAITGFQHLENRSYDLTDKNIIRLALKVNDDNALMYEAAIPIKNILGYPLGVNDAKKNFSIGLIIKGFQMNGSASPGEAVRGGSTRGGRGMSGGRGMGGRGGATRPMGGGSADRTALFKDDVNWYKFRLAYN